MTGAGVLVHGVKGSLGPKLQDSIPSIASINPPHDEDDAGERGDPTLRGGWQPADWNIYSAIT